LCPVSIWLSQGYNLKRWDDIAVVAQGALAEKVKIYKYKFYKKQQKLIAHFKRQDLLNLTADGRTPLTVTAIFEHNGKQIAFEGSDFVYLK